MGAITSDTALLSFNNGLNTELPLSSYIERLDDLVQVGLRSRLSLYEALLSLLLSLFTSVAEACMIGLNTAPSSSLL